MRGEAPTRLRGSEADHERAQETLEARDRRLRNPRVGKRAIYSLTRPTRRRGGGGATQEQEEGIGMAGGRGSEAGGQAPQALLWRERRVGHRQFHQQALDQAVQEVLLVADVVIERHRSDTQAPGDGAHTHRRQASLRSERERRVEHLFAGDTGLTSHQTNVTIRCMYMAYSQAGRRSSRTAELMAIQRGLESRHSRATRLFEDPFARRFVSPGWRVVLSAARIGLVRRMIERLYDYLGGPGPRASAVARTRLIDDILADATLATEQVVILGAGFDCRAYRLPGLAARIVFEVDHPGTQALKRKRLDPRPATTTSTVRHAPVDFERDDLSRALQAVGYDKTTPGLFLWEGVTNYLTADAVEETLAAIRRLACPQSTLVLTYIDRAALHPGAPAFPEAARWIEGVARRGEPWIFGLDPDDLADYLSPRGFSLTSDVSTAQAGDLYFPQRRRNERGSGLYHIATATVTP